MSKQVVSQQIEQVCDACGTKKVWDLIKVNENPLILQEMQEWYQVAHKVVHPQTGELMQLSGDACSLPCVAAVAVKIARPPMEEGDSIDLAALQVNREPIN